MAIVGPSSYIPSINEFLPHWAAVDTARSGIGLTVRISGHNTPVGRSELFGWRDELTAYAAGIEDRILDRDLTSSRVKLLRGELHERLNQFNRKSRSVLARTEFAMNLPKVPALTVGESRLFLSLNEMNSLWRQINTRALAGEIEGVTQPFTLLDDYSHAQFEAALGKLRVGYEQVLQHEQELRLTRTRRNLIQDKVYATLREYRAAVRGEFAAEDALVLTLPRLSPTPGATPDPVAVQVVWDESLAQAVVTWEASENANLDHYEVRYSPGASYDSDVETVQASVAPDATREFLTGRGLTKPGDAASFKVYVVLDAGNERGSQPVSIVRPDPSARPRTTAPAPASEVFAS
jgi:hypothetical protein